MSSPRPALDLESLCPPALDDCWSGCDDTDGEAARSRDSRYEQWTNVIDNRTRPPLPNDSSPWKSGRVSVGTSSGGVNKGKIAGKRFPVVVDRATFQAELDALRFREQAHTHQGCAITAARRRLPMDEADSTLAPTAPHGPGT